MFVISFLHFDNSSSTHVHVLGFLEARNFDDASIVELMHLSREHGKYMESAGDHRKMRSSSTSLSASRTATIAAALMCV
jgi:hypothetical protein